MIRGVKGRWSVSAGESDLAVEREDVARLDMRFHLDQVGGPVGGVEVELDLRSPDAEDDPLGVAEHKSVGGGKDLAGDLLDDFPNHML